VLAEKHRKPLVIHTREAAEDTLAVLRNARTDVILHCFSAPWRAADAAERGWYCSFAGHTTYPGSAELREAAAELPDDLVLVETDAPYLAPQTVRGKPNEPAYVVDTARVVAEARGVSYEELERIVLRGARVLDVGCGGGLLSEAMARAHVWITFAFGMVVYFIWLVQGLDGAPRRWSVLPSNYDTLTRVSLPFVVVLVLGQTLFFWNVFQTLRGKGGEASFDERGIPYPSERPRMSAPVAEAVLVLAALGLAAAFAVGGYLVGRETADSGPATVTQTGEPTESTPAAVVGDPTAGAEVFASAGCSGCHTFTPAGSTGASAR